MSEGQTSGETKGSDGNTQGETPPPPIVSVKKKRNSDQVFLRDILLVTFIGGMIWIIFGWFYSFSTLLISYQYQNIGGEIAEQLNSNTNGLIRFHQIMQKFSSSIIVLTGTDSNTTTDTDSQLETMNKLKNIIKDKVCKASDNTSVDDIVKEMLNTVNSENAGGIPNSMVHSVIPYATSTDNSTDESRVRYEDLFPRQTNPGDSNNIINKFLFELFYNSYNLLFFSDGTCFFIKNLEATITDPKTGAIQEYQKPLMIRDWVNKIVSAHASNTIRGSLFLEWTLSNYFCLIFALRLFNWDTTLNLMFGPILFGMTILFSCCCFAVIPFQMLFEGVQRNLYGENLSSMGYFGVFFQYVIFFLLSIITTPVYLLLMYFTQSAVKYKPSDGFDFIHLKESFPMWRDIFININSILQSFIFGVSFLIVGVSGIGILQNKYTNPPSINIQTSSIGYIAAMSLGVFFVWSVIQYIFPYQIESCKNGWYSKFESSYNKIKAMCKVDKIKAVDAKLGKPGKILLHTDKGDKPLQRDTTWFTLYPSVNVGAIIPFDLTGSPIFEVLTLLPSPLPLWITMAEPIYVHHISRKLPYLLEKLKVLYSGIQQIITTYNDGSIMINDLIAYVDKTIRTTLIPSPPTVESDMQIREVISLLFNVLNLYLVTHWYYMNQSEMTTFLFNIRNNLILLNRSISLESKDLEYLQNEKFMQDISKRVDNILTVVLSFPPTPIILPDNVYESYKPVSSPITSQMPWILPKLRTLYDFLTYTRAQLLNGKTVDNAYIEAQTTIIKSQDKTREIDDFNLDYSVSAILRAINVYLVDYINKWLADPNSINTNNLNIGLFSYDIAVLFFVINIRIRYIYELITKYQGTYTTQIVDKIQFSLNTILTDINPTNTNGTNQKTAVNNENDKNDNTPIVQTIPDFIDVPKISVLLSIMDKHKVGVTYQKTIRDLYIKSDDKIINALTNLKHSKEVPVNIQNGGQSKIQYGGGIIEDLVYNINSITTTCIKNIPEITPMETEKIYKWRDEYISKIQDLKKIIIKTQYRGKVDIENKPITTSSSTVSSKTKTIKPPSYKLKAVSVTTTPSTVASSSTPTPSTNTPAPTPDPTPAPAPAPTPTECILEDLNYGVPPPPPSTESSSDDKCILEDINA
jgi:hypothetical protein